MPRNPQPARRRLLVVHAHPDDESIATGGTLARYAAEGVRTVVVTCTDGAVGEISDGRVARSDNLAEVRARELRRAARILRVSRTVQLGYRDSGMAGTPDNTHPASFQQSPFEEGVARLVEIIRAERPQVVITDDERGTYGHPDHIRAHQLTLAACQAAAEEGRFPLAGVPWRPRKLYYTVVPRSLLDRMFVRLTAAGFGMPPRDASAVPFGVPDAVVSTWIDVSAYVGTKRAALASHRTQMGPGQVFARMSAGLFAECFSQEAFQRAGDIGGMLETDLFAGVGTVD